MDFGAAVLPWLSCALFLTALGTFMLGARESEFRYDMQVGIYLAGRITRIVHAAGLVLAATVSVLLGVGLLSEGYSFAWAFFPLAGVPSMTIGFYVYLASLPLEYPHEESDDTDRDPGPSLDAGVK